MIKFSTEQDFKEHKEKTLNYLKKIIDINPTKYLYNLYKSLSKLSYLDRKLCCNYQCSNQFQIVLKSIFDFFKLDIIPNYELIHNYINIKEKNMSKENKKSQDSLFTKVNKLDLQLKKEILKRPIKKEKNLIYKLLSI